MMMEMERQRRLQDDHMNGNWSFGSNHNPCSQTRKMSIGLVVDSSAKMKSTNGKGAVAELRTSQTVPSTKEIPAESKHKGKEVVSPDLGTQNKAPFQESTLLVRKKTSNQNMPYSDANGRANIVSSLPFTNNVPLQPSGNKIVGEKEPYSFFNLHDANEKKSNSNTYQQEKESSYATLQNGLEPKKLITEQGTSERGNTGPVTLRLKVQELLETVCSPDKKEDNSEAFGMDAKNLKLKLTTNKNDSHVATNGHHSNTKEINSGNVDHKIMRPLTRSLTGKKPQAQKSVPKKQTPFRLSEQAQRDENAFSFPETWSKRQTPDVNHGSKTYKRKESEISITRPVKTHVVEGAKKDERKTKADGSNVSMFGNRTRDSEIVKPTTEMKEKTRRQFEVIKTKHQPEGNNVNQNSFAKRSSTNNVDPPYDFKSSTFEAAKISSPVSLFQINKKNLDVDSPSEISFKMKRSSSFHSKGSLKGGHYNANKKNVAMDLEDSPFIESNHDENNRSKSPSKGVESETSFKTKRSSIFHSKGSLEGGPNANTKNVAMDLEDSPFIKPNHDENNRSTSPSKGVESDTPLKTKRSSSFYSKGSLKRGHSNANTKNVAMDLEDSPFIEPNCEQNNRSKSRSTVVESETSFKTKRGHYNANTKDVAMDLEDSPFIEPNHKENNLFKSPSKMVESDNSEDDSPISEPFIVNNHEGNKWSISPCQEEDSESSEDDSPIKVTGDGDCDKFDDFPEQDGFAGAVKLFAVALERIQSKIHSITSRQSAAILLSVSKNIHSQLQNAESKIQNEVGKLTNIGNSRKMHPENQCKEQQEQLKHIYDKFKEDVDKHLEKCRNTLEGLESHQIQVRGMVEKQRLSHKKFLLQTEEEIEKQLNDAQTRLTDVHRLARDQMHKLKFGIAECLKEGLLD